MKNLTLSILIILFGSLFYLLTLRGVPGNIAPGDIKNKLDQVTKPLELSPERGRFILTMSLVENRSFSLTKKLGEAAYPDVGFHDGKLYIFFAPGVSILAIPFYTMGKIFNLSQVFTFAIISIFAVANLVLIYILSRSILNLSVRLSLLATIIFGFATTSWSYAVTLYQHHVSLFLLLSGFYLVYKFKEKKTGKLISIFFASYIWFAYALAIAVDYPNTVLLLPVMIYFALSSINILKNSKKLQINIKFTTIVTSVVFIILMGLHLFHNKINYGDWRRTSGSLVSYKYVLESQKKNIETIKSYDPTLVKHFFSEEDFPMGLSILSFSRDRGLFLYAPIFALALLGIYSMRKKINLEIGTLLGVVGVNLFLYSSWGDPWGGWAYGPRYLIPSMAILAMFVGIWLNNSRNKLLSSLVTFVLFAYSCFIALLGALTTNQIPPKIEADFLKMKYNFLLNWDYFVDGRSGSFVFNEYASRYMTLQQYFLIIYISLILIVFTLLFVVPMFEKKKSL